MERNQTVLWKESLKSYLWDLVLGLLLLFAVSYVERAEAQPGGPDVALLLMIDTSSSVMQGEYELQKNGTIAAITGDEFWSGMSGTEMAIAIMEWSDQPWTVVPWTVVRTQEEMIAAVAPYVGWTRKTYGSSGPGGYGYGGGAGGTYYGGTALGYSLQKGVEYMEQCGCSKRRIIDVSGDGSDNGGTDPRIARDIAAERGITINGLAIVNEEKTLREYYENHIVTPGDGFAVEANDFGVYERVLVRKLLLEVS